jgi:hypothetical protein
MKILKSFTFARALAVIAIILSYWIFSESLFVNLVWMNASVLSRELHLNAFFVAVMEVVVFTFYLWRVLVDMTKTWPEELRKLKRFFG